MGAAWPLNSGPAAVAPAYRLRKLIAAFADLNEAERLRIERYVNAVVQAAYRRKALDRAERER